MGIFLKSIIGKNLSIIYRPGRGLNNRTFGPYLSDGALVNVLLIAFKWLCYAVFW